MMRWFYERWALFRAWCKTCRELHEAREDTFARERRLLRLENEELRAKLAIEKRNADFLAKINAKHVAMIEAEIALNKRLEADALQVAPKQ